MKVKIQFSILLGLMLTAIAFATVPTTILSTDLLVNSRTTINNNFTDLYNQRASLVDCSGVVGRFVVTLNGAAVASGCGTLTWSNITALSGFPGVVTTWNGRANAVTMTSGDVAGVEQDLRPSASPSFVSISASNSGGYAFSTTSSASGISLTGISGNVFTATTAQAHSMDIADSGGSCRLSSAAGMVCTGTQDVRTTATPTFNGLIATQTAPVVSSGQVGFGGTVAGPSACGSLAGAVGCVAINVAGTPRYVPYY